MCEYCNSNDIDRAKAQDAAKTYKAMERHSIVPADDVFEHMLAIYSNPVMADYAVKRIESRNVKCTLRGQIGVLAGDVVSELESLLFCRGDVSSLLDG